MFLIDFLQRSWHANEVVQLVVEQNTFRQKESHSYHPASLSKRRERETHTHSPYEDRMQREMGESNR